MLAIVPSCNPVQYQEKLIMQISENDGKQNFGPSSGSFDTYLGPEKKNLWVLLLLVVRHSSNLLSYPISRKTNKANLRKLQKT